MSTFDTYSFGCRVNQAEMEALGAELESQGLRRHREKPELYIINTCSVTHKADREARQLIYQTKKNFPETKIVVTGCAATHWIKTRTQIAEVDLIVDNSQKEYLASLIHERILKKTKPAHTVLSSMPHDALTRSGRLMVKIQDGCQRFCTFCIVPYLRGLPRSLHSSELIEQVNSAVHDGISEVIYAAINTEAYGYDTKETFIQLIEDTLADTTIPRLSFGSIHPWSIDDNFFKFYQNYKNSERLVHFFHIPLQSGAESTLRLMKRGYTAKEFCENLHTIKKMNPMAFLATDVIVGFLEEREEDFEETYSFLESSPLSRFHVFRFSPRRQTAAFYMKKRLFMPSDLVAHERSVRLRTLSASKFRNFQEEHIGKEGVALVLEQKKDNTTQALFSNQMPLMITTASIQPGRLTKVHIHSLKNGMLFADVL